VAGWAGSCRALAEGTVSGSEHWACSSAGRRRASRGPITGRGLVIDGQSNVIVENLIFADGEDDAVHVVKPTGATGSSRPRMTR